MKKRALGWLIFVSFLFFLAVSSAAITSIYATSVTVKSQADDERLQAFRVALSQVVNQVSGNRMMATQLKINMMTNLYPYIQRYYYQNRIVANNEEDESDEEEDAQVQDNTATQSQHLVVEFDSLSVDNLIKTVDVPVNANLTPILLWLSVNDKGKPWLLSSDGDISLAKQIKFMGKNKSLDITLPMFDLDDVNALSTNEVDKFNVAAITQASMRYGSDLILVGSVGGENKNWKAHWMLLKNGKRFTWDDHGSTLNGAILSGLLKASELMSNPDTVATISGSHTGHLILIITGIDNVTHYASVNAYLQGIDVVSSLEVLRVEPSRIIFDVVLANNDKEGFIKSLTANPHFISQPSSSSQELNYTWK